MPYDNNLTGFLGRNERKRDDKDPDFTGSAEIAQVQYYISAWVNEGKPGSKIEGKRYFNLKFKPKEARAPVAPRDDDMAPTPVATPTAEAIPPPPMARASQPTPVKSSTVDESEIPF